MRQLILKQKLFAFIVGITLFYAGTLNGQQYDTTLWLTDKGVYATKLRGDTLFIGGDFERLGPRMLNLVSLDTLNGIPDTLFPQSSSVVTTLPDAHGGLFIRGANNSVIGGTYFGGGVARVDAGGNIIPGWPAAWPGVSQTSPVQPALAYGEKIYVKGNFLTLGNFSSTGLQADSSGVLNWQIPTANGTVNWSKPDGNGGWYIGGTFTQIGGQPRNSVAQFDAQGTLLPWNPVVNGAVKCVMAIPGGVVIGGTFTTVNGISRNSLAFVDAVSGSNTFAWNPNVLRNNNAGEVLSLDTAVGVLYIGGFFNSFMQATRNNLAAVTIPVFTLASWAPVANGAVKSVVINNSWIYIGGTFSQVSFISRNNICRINSAGTVDSWNPNANGEVRGISFGSYGVYAWGWFGSIGSQTRRYAAALDINTGLAKPWNPGLSTMPLSSIVPVAGIHQSGRNIFMGGNFPGTGLSQEPYLFRSDTSGNYIADALYVSSYVATLTGDGSGHLFIGGDFYNVNGVTREGLAQLDFSSGNLTPWVADVMLGTQVGQICGVFPFDSTVVIVGNFTDVNNTSRSHIAAVDTINGTLTSFYPSLNGPVFAAWQDDSLLYIKGSFTLVNGIARNGFAVINLSTGQLSTFNPQLNGSLNTIAFSPTHIYMGGFFTTADNIPRNRLAAWDKSTWTLDNNWVPQIDVPPTMLFCLKNQVFIHAGFMNINGLSRRNMAGVDAFSGATRPVDIQVIGSVYSMDELNNRLIVGGGFTGICYLHIARLAAYSMTTGRPFNWNPGVESGSVNALDLIGDSLFAGGSFSGIAGNPVKNLAAVHAATGAVIMGYTPQPDSTVEALIRWKNKLYAGGLFHQIGGQPRAFFAELDSAGQAAALDLAVDNDVLCLASQGSRIYLGGRFSTVSGQPRAFIAAVDSAGTPANWIPDPNNDVISITPAGGLIYITGKFTTVNGNPHYSAAAVDGLTGLCSYWYPGFSSSPNDYGTVLFPDGDVVYVGGSFSTLSGQTRNYLGAVNRQTFALYPWNGSISPFYTGFFVKTISRTPRGILATGYANFPGGSKGMMFYDPEFNNAVSGTVFADLDHDTIQNGYDYPKANVRIDIAPGNQFALTNQGGYYSSVLDTGSFVLTPANPYLFASAVPATHTAVFNQPFSQSDTGNVFALQPVDSVIDLVVMICPITPARPGQPLCYEVVWHNNGATPVLNTTVIFKPDSLIALDSASLNPVIFGADSIQWNTGTLVPGQLGRARVYGQLPISVSLGDIIQSSARVLPEAQDTIKPNNRDTINHVVSTAYDPNDKQVFPSDSLIPLGTDVLHYMVRFQNTGTDTAFTVHIRDTLSPLLDVNTLQVLASSHNWNAQVNQDRVLFTFNNILLPDSFRNEPESHGYIVYEIALLPNLPPGTVINNSASIYFDYNDPVLTNTTSTTLDTLNTTGIPEKKQTGKKLFMYPNPATNKTTLIMTGVWSEKAILTIMDMQGRAVVSDVITGAVNQVETDQLSAGVYLVMITDALTGEKAMTRLIKTER